MLITDSSHRVYVLYIGYILRRCFLPIFYKDHIVNELTFTIKVKKDRFCVLQYCVCAFKVFYIVKLKCIINSVLNSFVFRISSRVLDIFIILFTHFLAPVQATDPVNPDTQTSLNQTSYNTKLLTFQKRLTNQRLLLWKILSNLNTKIQFCNFEESGKV